MSKKESTFLNMTMTLFLVTLLSATALGFVYELTKEPIAASKLAKKINAIKNVVPDFNNNPIEEQYTIKSKGEDYTFFPAKMDEQLVGTAVQASTKKGFVGEIKLMVGFLPSGKLYDISVLEHKETPGMGDKMEKDKSDFTQQFKNIDPTKFTLSVKNDGGDVDVITAATISSRAFCDAVQKTYDAYNKKVAK